MNGEVLLGMRVPVVVASPFTRGDPNNPRVISTVYDHTSVLKLIEWRWGVEPLTARDASDDVGNLVTALNFKNADAAVPDLPHPTEPPLEICLDPFPIDAVGLSDLVALNPFPPAP